MGVFDFFRSTIKVRIAGMDRELDLSQIGKYCKPLDGREFKDQAALESAIRFLKICTELKAKGLEYRSGVSKNLADIVNTLKKTREQNTAGMGEKADFKTDFFNDLFKKMYEEQYLGKYKNEIELQGNIVAAVNACIADYDAKKDEVF